MILVLNKIKEQLSWDFKRVNYYNADANITPLVLCNLSFPTCCVIPSWQTCRPGQDRQRFDVWISPAPFSLILIKGNNRVFCRLNLEVTPSQKTILSC